MFPFYTQANKTKQYNTDITQIKDTAYAKEPGCVDVPVQYRRDTWRVGDTSVAHFDWVLSMRGDEKMLLEAFLHCNINLC